MRVQLFLPEQTPQRVDVPYTFFKAQVTADNVTEVTSRADVIQGTFREPVTYPPDRQDGKTSPQFQTVRSHLLNFQAERLSMSHSRHKPRKQNLCGERGLKQMCGTYWINSSWKR